MLVVLFFGVVYLTDSVTGRFKQRSMALFKTSEKLRTRSPQRLILSGRDRHSRYRPQKRTWFTEGEKRFAHGTHRGDLCGLCVFAVQNLLSTESVRRLVNRGGWADLIT
jgi:hypothetical protein